MGQSVVPYRQVGALLVVATIFSALGADQELTYDMPTYQYRCITCDIQFDVRQSFTDEPISVCVDEGCDGEVKKVFGNVGIAFKGSGFYKNDSRSSSKQSDSSGSTDDKKRRRKLVTAALQPLVRQTSQRRPIHQKG